MGISQKHIRQMQRKSYKEMSFMAAKVNEEKCIGCGSCASVCPVDAITVTDGKAKVSDACIECGACAGECPVEANSI